MHPVVQWLDGLMWVPDGYGSHDPNVDALRTLQLALRLDPPLNWGGGGQSAISSVKNRAAKDRIFALDVLDFFVQKVAKPGYADELGQILTVGGSEWEVAELGEDARHLAKRVVGPVRRAIDGIGSDSERAHHHLSTAWAKLVGRNPDPSAAYREAIRAVEAAAKPVVTPDDPGATLGKIVRAIRDKPEKWIVVLDKSTPEQIADMCDLIWKGQLDRHGTDEPGARLNVSQGEADAAVHIAISLARIFSSGGIRRV